MTPSGDGALGMLSLSLYVVYMPEHTLSLTTNGSFGGSLTNATYDSSGDWSSSQWYKRAIITKPDSTATAIYFDEVGQQLAKVNSSTTAFSGSPAPLLWITKMNRDSSGRITDIATPAAGNSSGYDHATGAVAIKTTGLVRQTTYHSSGRLQATPEYVKSKDGSGGSPVTSSRSASFDTTRGSKSFAEGSNTVYLNRLLTTQHDAYRSSTVIDSTTISRTFWNDTAVNAQYWAPKTTTTTLPALESGDSSGPATVTMKVWMDQRGRAIFAQDGAGKYTYTKYNSLGQVVKRIEDPASTDSDANADASTYSITLSSTGLNYATTYTYDDQGRLLTTTLPSGRVSAMHYTQLADGRMVTLSVGKQSGGTSEGPVSYTVINAAGKAEAQGVIALPTTSNANGSTTAAMSTWITTTSSDVIGAVAVGTLKQLTVNIYDAPGAHLESSRVFNSIPTAYSSATSGIYDETTYGYDEMGRTRRVKDATGTITRSTFDALGRVTQRLVGTDDTGLAGGMTGGTSNMVKVEDITYDAGGVGNGLVTSRTQLVNSTLGNDRTTSYSYDYRNRLVLQTNPVAPHSLMKYDDAGHVIAVGSYSTAPSASADPTSTTTNRVALTESTYNSRGQVRSTTRHAITQSTGASADTLVSSMWYDGAGRVIKSKGEQLSKVQYDVLGRPTISCTLAKDNDTSYTDTTTLTGDTVVEERQTLYDDTGKTGLALMSVQVARHPKDTSTTGGLDAVGDAIDVVAVGNANFKGRAQITSMYYDVLDRPSATVTLGTNGGSTYTRSSDTSVGTRSATRLIQSTTYNADGTVQGTTDAMGRVTRTEYDAARRRTRVIANYVDGTPGGGTWGDNDQVVEYAYTNGLMTSLTAKMPSSSDDQTTTYAYGVTTTGTLPSTLASNRLLRQVQYPDSSGGTDVVLYAYNRLGQQTAMLDQAGNQIDTSYDVGGRELTRVVTTLASGFDGSVRRIAMAYLDRGMIDTVTQYDAATSGSVTDQVKYEYDAWGNLEHFRQDVDSAMDGSGVSLGGRAAFDVVTTHAKAAPTGGVVQLRRTGVDYKAAGTTFEAIGYTYGSSGSIADTLGRVATVTTAVSGGSPTTIASYDYLGSSQLVGTTLDAAGLETSVFAYSSGTHTYADLDAFGRPTRWDWNRVGGAALYDYTVSYDENSNPTSSVDNLAVRNSTSKHIFDTVYSLDGLNRVIGADEGQKTGSAIESGTRTRNELWNSLSLTGNWRNRQLDANGDGDFTDAEDRDEPLANNTFNKANEWTARRIEKAGSGNYESYSYTYDAVGNLTTQAVDVYTSGTQTGVASRTFVYDAFGRLVKVTSPYGTPPGDNRVVQYKYNGLGFRIMTQTDADGDESYEDGERTYFMYDDRWRMVGSFADSGSTPNEAFIYHNAGIAGRGGSSYIDSVILRDRDNAGDTTLEERRVYCQNWRADVVAVTKDDGTSWEYVMYCNYDEPSQCHVNRASRHFHVRNVDARAKSL